MNNVGSNGNYWSSSPNTSNASNAYNMNFNTGNVNPQNNNNRNNGFTVRLVYPSEQNLYIYCERHLKKCLMTEKSCFRQ